LVGIEKARQPEIFVVTWFLNQFSALFMISIVYAIVFKGEILEGFQPISVKAHLSKLLKADGDRMKVLFSGKQVVIKRTADKAEAAKYTNALKKIGADIKVKGIKVDAPSAKPKVAKPAAAPAATPAATPVAPPTGDTAPEDAPVVPDVSGISLAPNEGNIVEPTPEPPPPNIDLSGIEVAENDGTPLIEPALVEVVEIDLSEFSVAENDGEPLVEPSNEVVPKIDVPDFGLDVPGAVLETIQEEKELLNPDTTGMTLAMAGIELLEPEDKDQEPPPPAPDTSSIHLVSNFDV
jgi:hypothetical protein|tara:strand:- start:462 stop:1340 length:879 start_codon:yes stop_codon:yes gene_type:complete